MDEVSQNCAMLFRGGKVAIDHPSMGGFRPWTSESGAFQPADGDDWVTLVHDHLWTGPSIGVYPLTLYEDEFDVYWGCVDWDTGPAESYVHACNVREACGNWV